MQILHVVGGELDGGAARGALFLHQALQRRGVASRMLLADAGRRAGTPLPQHVTAIRGGRAGWLRTVAHRKLERLPLHAYRQRPPVHFDTGLCGYDIASTAAYRWADVVHLHYVNDGLLSLSGLRKLDKPVLWTLRDMWPMTGGCHYALDCAGYRDTCGGCPALGSERHPDLATWLQGRKRRALPPRLALIAVSRWLGDCAQGSQVLGHLPLSVIPNGIDTRRFAPLDPHAARQQLGIPSEGTGPDAAGPLVLAGAVDHGAPYKGYDLLCNALAALATGPLRTARGRVAMFGRIPHPPPLPQGWRFLDLGTLRDNSTLRAAYASADVFVAASRQEAFGKTLVEAMACGTPVVAFDGTGPADIVDHKHSGYLAAELDPADLARGIEWTLAPERVGTLRALAREHAVTHFDIEGCAHAYEAQYRALLG